MYLFSRSARLGVGNSEASMAWAITVTEKVNQISELEVNLWSSVFSPGLGTLAWTASVENLVQLEASDAKLTADTGYLSLVDEGAKYSSGQAIDDSLINLVHADADAAEINATYANVVSTSLAPGATVSGMELGVQIAQQAKAITGCPTSFGAHVTGAYGAVSWFTLFESVEQMQAANEAIGANLEFAQLIDAKGPTNYDASVTTQLAYRKVL
jgi:hypothetical protein